jgi:hypothetical protein
MVFNTVRNYLSEIRNTIKTEWKLYSKFGQTTLDPTSEHPDADLRRLQTGYRHADIESKLTSEYREHYSDTRYGFEESNHMKGTPFEFYMDINPSDIPENRLPEPGITVLPLRYHSEQVVTATESVPETGFQLHPLLRYLIDYKYPRYAPHVDKYVRPLGTTDATFSDFNREQKEYPPVSAELTARIVPIVTSLLGARKFLPLHYVDTFFAKMPLHTGTSYFYRHSYELRTHAAFSHPKEYAAKQTSKGYFINAFTEYARTIVHHIKSFGVPFNPENLTPSQQISRLRDFICEHATMLFTRNHISDKDGNLKQRPVYAMDTLFLHLEAMITFPLHIMARSTSSSIMYSIETIRGGCAYMDQQAKRFRSYLCIDWSSFDQRMPWIIVDTFFTVFLPSLLIISFGYAPTAEYPEYPGLTIDKMFSRIFNIICFLRLWYFNCVFVTADGFAYIRRFAGIASGMLNTQYLDSYCNLFLMVHALLHFGATETEIYQFMIFVMGDDNVILSHWPLDRLQAFLNFFEEHALTRFGMVLSRQKSIITQIRTRIEMLGYVCNGGQPNRPLAKLVAQLCYPEHGPQDKYMSSRAIGMAWAAAGMDPTFHNFCKDVFHTFLPYAEPLTPETQAKISKHLPGMFKMLDSIDEFISLESFPDIHTVRLRFRTWQGELDNDKKWSPAHFLFPPDFDPAPSVTLSEYMTEHNLSFPEVTTLFP